MSVPDRLSVPDQRARPPRAPTDEELRGLLRVADVLIPRSGAMPAGSQAPGYETWLARALAARPDAFEAVLAAATRLGGLGDAELATELRRLCADEPLEFHPLSAVVAGAYLMVPEIRAAIGYPGQERKHPRFDEAAEEIMDGILDPVIERGSIYTPA